MRNTRVFRILKNISTLVIIALLGTGGYFGYKAYQDSLSSNIDTKGIESSTKNAKDIDWGGIFASVQDSPKKPSEHSHSKPLLAIIMDDMAYPSQLKNLQKLGLIITPSFFPVSKDSPDTAKMAASVPFYMVHLPMEATTQQKSRHQWIRTGMTKEEINQHIVAIKRDFPRLMFLNNHTGSKFTASMPDMQNLLAVLGENGIEFVDSRTTQDSVVAAIYKQQGRKLLERDVFLDNTLEVGYILKQIESAVSLAKKKGYAIAICHPHTATFKALDQAKKSVLQEVELVYIKDIPISRALMADNIATEKRTKSSLTNNVAAKQGVNTAQHTKPQKPDTSIKTQATKDTLSNESSMHPTTQTTSSMPAAQENPFIKESLPSNVYLEGNEQAESGTKALDQDSSAQGLGTKDTGVIAQTAVPTDNKADVVSNESNKPIATVDSKQDNSTQGPVSPSQAAHQSSQDAKAQVVGTSKPIEPKPSKIDKTMFDEAKRQSKQKSATKPKQPPQKQKQPTFDTIKDCEQSDVEAFVSGCPSDRKSKNKQQGFINLEWNNKQGSSSQSTGAKPRDFLDSDDIVQ